MCKGSANREKNKINLFIFYSEMKPTFCKGSANREKNKIKIPFCFIFRFINATFAEDRLYYHGKLKTR